MSAEGISSEQPDGAPAALPALTLGPALSGEADNHAGLRRANAELSLLYAVEHEIAGTHELSRLIVQVLGRMRALLQVEVAAAMITQASEAEVYAVSEAGPLPLSTLESRAAERLIEHNRTPIRRAVDKNGSAAALLVEPPSVRVSETFSAPISDGRSQLGVLQLINPRERDDEDIVLRKLGLVAAQLGRAIVLRREHEAAERAERLALLGNALNAILHDMRSPLRVLTTALDSLIGEDSQPLRGELAARGSRALSQLERMVLEVLSFARGQREVQIRSVQLPRFIEEVREMLLPEVESFSASLEVHSDYDGPARFDESKLKRILWNLARNACEAGADKFAWRIARSGEKLVFECTDSGRGIPKLIEGRLFDSFSSHGKTEAAGLGLAMAKKIVDAHCGRIHVNPNPPHGTAFRIEIPI
jgi:K+-sensing histidine kinase KdpD